MKAGIAGTPPDSPRAKPPPGTALVAIWLPSGSSMAAVLLGPAMHGEMGRSGCEKHAVRAGADAGAGVAARLRRAGRGGPGRLCTSRKGTWIGDRPAGEFWRAAGGARARRRVRGQVQGRPRGLQRSAELRIAQRLGGGAGAGKVSFVGAKLSKGAQLGLFVRQIGGCHSPEDCWGVIRPTGGSLRPQANAAHAV